MQNEKALSRELETKPSSHVGDAHYVQEVYDWAYVKPGSVGRLDNDWMVKLLLFGHDQRLMQSYLKHIQPGMTVWQIAHVYGTLVRRAALQCGSTGQFILTDITPIQIKQARHKLVDLPQAQVLQADAATFKTPQSCDVLCSFFLLHEVPDSWKRRIVNNMLSQLPEHGQAIFVDYHRPAWWQPAGYILRLVNRFLEPFAHALWKHSIASYATHPENYTWEKTTLFGGVYQVVYVKHRPKEQKPAQTPDSTESPAEPGSC